MGKDPGLDQFFDHCFAEREISNGGNQELVVRRGMVYLRNCDTDGNINRAITALHIHLPFS